MTEQTSDHDKMNELTKQFIDLANQMKEQGYPIEMINGALIGASATYSTYLTAGNEGYLKPSGVEKVMTVYQRFLENLQMAKKAEIEKKQP